MCCGERGFLQAEGGIPISWVWLTGLEVYSQTAGLSCICIHRKKNACIDYSSFLNLKVFISISENRTERTSEWNVETHLKLISVYGFQMNLGFMLCHRCQRWYIVKYEELMFQIKWTWRISSNTFQLEKQNVLLILQSQALWCMTLISEYRSRGQMITPSWSYFDLRSDFRPARQHRDGI